MATVTHTAQFVERTPHAGASERQVLRLSDVDWDGYLTVQKVFDRQRGFRLAYDRGELEIMSPTLAHDDDSRFLGDLVRVGARAARLPSRRGGSVTMRTELLQKGIEPDDCFWIQNAEKVAGARELDLDVLPPPDLGIEVDVSRSSLNRFSIYAALRIAEIWRLEGDALTFFLLTDRGEYTPALASRALPHLRPDDVMRFVHEGRVAVDQGEVLDQFREWYGKFLAGIESGE
ncbi:MAG: Uma2 family endonuclease [Planctomycetaceae bacterium]|nr:Uma2 family endonuclease [Planctomycetaceae bacterium]